MKMNHLISLILSSTLLISQANAASRCLANIDNRIIDGELNLELCQLQPAEIPTIIAFINAHQNIESLNLGYNYVGTEAIIALANNVKLKKMNLRLNLIQAEGAKALANNPYLQELILDENKIGDEGAVALSFHKNITRLDIASNQVTEVGARIGSQ